MPGLCIAWTDFKFPDASQRRGGLNFIVGEPFDLALWRVAQKAFPASFRYNIDKGPFIPHQRVWRDALHEKNVCANRRSGANDGFTPQDRSIGIDGNPVLYIRMSFSAFLYLAVFILLEAAGPEGYPVVKLNVRTDAASFAYNNSGSMIDEERATDARTGVDIYAGSAMGPLGHDSRNKR